MKLYSLKTHPSVIVSVKIVPMKPLQLGTRCSNTQAYEDIYHQTTPCFSFFAYTIILQNLFQCKHPHMFFFLLI